MIRDGTDRGQQIGLSVVGLNFGFNGTCDGRRHQYASYYNEILMRAGIYGRGFKVGLINSAVLMVGSGYKVMGLTTVVLTVVDLMIMKENRYFDDFERQGEDQTYYDTMLNYRER